jgi:hypothetical protein
MNWRAVKAVVRKDPSLEDVYFALQGEEEAGS